MERYTAEYYAIFNHPKYPELCREFFIVVSESWQRNDARYLNCGGLGVSKDYVATDEQAIRNFAAEHGCKVTSIRKREKNESTNQN